MWMWNVKDHLQMMVMVTLEILDQHINHHLRRLCTDDNRQRLEDPLKDLENDHHKHQHHKPHNDHEHDPAHQQYNLNHNHNQQPVQLHQHHTHYVKDNQSLLPLMHQLHLNHHSIPPQLLNNYTPDAQMKQSQQLQKSRKFQSLNWTIFKQRTTNLPYHVHLNLVLQPDHDHHHTTKQQAAANQLQQQPKPMSFGGQQLKATEHSTYHHNLHHYHLDRYHNYELGADMISMPSGFEEPTLRDLYGVMSSDASPSTSTMQQ